MRVRGAAPLLACALVLATVGAGPLPLAAAAGAPPAPATTPTTLTTPPSLNQIAPAPVLAPDQPVPAAPTATTSWLARIVYGTAARSAPSSSAHRLGTVEAESPWGGVNQLLVLQARTVAGVVWIHVRLPGRPNASAGWIPAKYAALTQTSWRIAVSRSEHRLWVFRNGVVVKRAAVVVGKASTPTPAGLFAIADKLRQATSTGFLGTWVLPLTAHSSVLQHFDGGDGQVALHGRGGASLSDPLGTARSHGCVRLDNSLIGWIAQRVPVGTPVNVS